MKKAKKGKPKDDKQGDARHRWPDTWWFRAYLSQRAHFVVFCLVGVAIVLCYLLSHCWRWESYWEGIKNPARNAFRIFKVGPSDDGHRWVLLVKGREETSLDTLPDMPFGLQHMASVHGVLSHYRHLAEGASRVYERRRVAFLRRFHYAMGYHVLALDEMGLAESGVELRLSPETFRYLQALQGFSFVDGFAEQLRNRIIYDPAEQQHSQNKENDSPSDPNEEKDSSDTSNDVVVDSNHPRELENTSTWAYEARDAAFTSLSAGRSYPLRFNALNINGVRRYPTAQEKEAFERRFQEWNRELQQWFAVHETSPAEVGDQADPNAPSSRAGSDPNTVGTVSLTQVQKQANEDLAQALLDTLRVETRPLWLLGHYRWMEIVFWVWFGVFTHCLASQSKHLVQSHAHGGAWRPSETWRSLSKLIYAPLLAMALFFLAAVIEQENTALAFGRNSWATLGISFLIGMYPNTVYRVLKHALPNLLQDKIAHTDRGKAAPETVVAKIDVSHKKEGGVYTLDQLKHNVAEVVTSSLKGGNL